MKEATYVELEVRGSADQAIGFVEGFRLARDRREEIWFAGRENVDLDGFLEKLRNRLHRDAHLILVKPLAEELARAIEKSELVDLAVESMEEIDYAELQFDYEVYTRDEGGAVRRVIESDLPDGVRLEGYDPEETVREDARGVELYGPVHHYTLRAEGRYVGAVPGILALAHRLADQDFIHPDKITLHHRS